jgi:branched-chain amino acid transport system substrate-binding protein
VYSSLPLSGVAHRQGAAIANGARLAVEEAGGFAGAHPVTYVSLDDATRASGYWTPERAFRNARRATENPASRLHR